MTVAIISCSKRSFCHFGAVDFILLNRFSEIPSSEIIPYCFSYYFFGSHRLSFLLFSLLAPLIFITDPSLASSWHLYPQGLFDLFQVHSLVWVWPVSSDKCPLPPLYLPPQIQFESMGYLKWGVTPPVRDVMKTHGAHLLDQLITSFLLQPQGICQQPGAVTTLIIILNLSFPRKASLSRMCYLFSLFFFFILVIVSYECSHSFLFCVTLDYFY